MKFCRKNWLKKSTIENFFEWFCIKDIEKNIQ